MTIKTENFRKYQKLITISYDDSQRSYSHIYLDFVNSTAYSYNNKFILKFTFEHTVDYNLLPNVYLSIPEFQQLCLTFTELTLSYKNDKVKLSDGANKAFKIPCFIERYDIPQWDGQNIKTLNLTGEYIKYIVNALKFTYKSEDDVKKKLKDRNLDGIRIGKETIISGNGGSLYEASFGDNKINFILEIETAIASLIPIIPADEVILAYDEDNEMMKISVEDQPLEIFFTSLIEHKLSLPNSDDQNFIDKYNHDTFITFNKDSMISTLNFYVPFVRDIINECILIEIVDEKTINIKIDGFEKDGTWDLEVVQCSPEIIGKEFLLSRYIFQEAITTVDTDIIMLQVAEGANAFNVRSDLLEKSNEHVAIIALT